MLFSRQLWNPFEKKLRQLVVVAHNFNPNTWEIEAGIFLWVHVWILSKKQTNNNNNNKNNNTQKAKESEIYGLQVSFFPANILHEESSE